MIWLKTVLCRPAVLAVVVAASFLAAQAQVAFSPSINLSANYPGGSFLPRIIVEASGAADVIWVEDNTAQPHYDVFFSHSTDGGLSFSTPVNVSLNPGTLIIRQPSMAVDLRGNIYVAWRLFDSTQFIQQGSVYFSRSTDGGKTFSVPLAVSNPSLEDPQMGVDPSGNINMVWSETGSNGSHVEFSRSTDGGSTFSAPKQITAEDGSGGPTHTSLLVDSQGGINVMSAGFVTHFTRSSDGATFSEADLFDNQTAYDCCSPLAAPMAVDSGGSIYAVAFSEASPQAVILRKSTDGGVTFSAPKTIINNPALSRAQITVDSRGVIRVLGFPTGGSGGQGAFLFFTTSTDGGATFSTPVNSVATDGEVSSVQHVEDSSGNINLVWSDDVNLNGSGFGSNNNSQVFWNISGDGGVTFSPTINVSNDANQAFSPMLAVDARGNSFLVWAESSVGSSQSSIQFSRSTSLSSLSVTPASVTGSVSATGTVTLSAPAFRGGVTVLLSSSAWNVASVPDTLTVPEGATTASFTIATSSVSQSTLVTITGTYAGQSQAASLTLQPPNLVAVILDPNSVTGGDPITGTVALDVQAPAGGTAVKVTSSDLTVARGPLRSVLVPQFATGASFTVFTNPSAQTASATITASAGNGTQTASLTVTPNPPSQLVSSGPRNISNTPGISASQQIAVDSSGNIYVVWGDNTPGHFDVFFSRSTNGGATFSAPQNISNNPGGASGPQIAVDSNGNIDVVWFGNSPNADIFFSRSTDGGGSFSAPQNISNNAGNSNVPLMAVDSAGNINVIWADKTPGNIDVFFSRSTDGGTTFSAPQNLTPTNSGPLASNPVQIAVDSAGNINILFRFASQDTDVRFIRSTDGGNTFSAPRQITPHDEGGPEARMAVDASGNVSFVHTTGQSSQTLFFNRTTDGGATLSETIISNSLAFHPQIAVDSSGGINVVWLAASFGSDPTQGFVFARSGDNGASFSAPVTLSNDNTVLNQQLAVDANGNINVVWQSSAAGKPQVFFSRSSDGGATFSLPQNLSNDSGNASFPLVAADLAGNVNIAWTDDTPGNSEIFFSREASPGSLSSLAINSSSVTGGDSATGTVTLVSPAPTGGVAVSLQSSNWNVASVPDPVVVPAGATTTAFSVATGPVSQPTPVTITGSLAGENVTVSLTIVPPTLSAHSLSPAGVTGGSSVTGTVTLNQQAPAGGIVVSLAGSDTTVASVPATVTVPQFATSVSYAVTTNAVAQPAAVTISATSGGVMQAASLTVAPPVPIALSLDQSSVKSGAACTGTVQLNGPAPSAGAVVSLSSSNATVASGPDTVTVPAGATTVAFTVNTGPVSQSTSVTLSASYQGTNRTASLTVSP